MPTTAEAHADLALPSALVHFRDCMASGAPAYLRELLLSDGRRGGIAFEILAKRFSLSLSGQDTRAGQYAGLADGSLDTIVVRFDGDHRARRLLDVLADPRCPVAPLPAVVIDTLAKSAATACEKMHATPVLAGVLPLGNVTSVPRRLA